MNKHLVIIAIIFLSIILTNNLYAEGKNISLSANLIASVGRFYYGAEFHLINIGVGYYYSPAPNNGTKGRYIPLYLISKSDKVEFGFGFDVTSIFTKKSNNKSSPQPTAYEFYTNFYPISLLSIGTRYFWSAGGYLPKGLSFSVGLQTPNL
ncbi:MAG: hypothetical protein ABIK31_05170 [candidate division WOR-3 bacterium]